MIALTIATIQEAQPLLGLLNLEGTDVFYTTKTSKGRKVVIAIVGMGKEKAQKGMESLFRRYAVEEVTNLGIAGALNPDLHIGGLYRVDQAVDWGGGQEIPVPCVPGRFVHLPSARLVTSATPVFSDEERRGLRPYGDLVDMEGAIIAGACAEQGVPITAVKCISDFAGDGDRETLRKNLVRLSTVLADLVVERFWELNRRR